MTFIRLSRCRGVQLAGIQREREATKTSFIIPSQGGTQSTLSTTGVGLSDFSSPSIRQSLCGAKPLLLQRHVDSVSPKHDKASYILLYQAAGRRLSILQASVSQPRSAPFRSCLLICGALSCVHVAFTGLEPSAEDVHTSGAAEKQQVAPERVEAPCFGL